MQLTRAAQRVAGGLAFLAGVGFAAVPAAGPFLALLTWLNQRLELQRADRLWWSAATLLSLPFLATGHLTPAVETLAQVLAAWLLFRSATALRERLAPRGLTGVIGAGLVVGLLIAFLVGLRQLDGFRWETARTPLDAVTWQTHPATFGHMMLVLSALLAIVVPSPRLRVVALGIGAAGVVLSGAREAMIAWLLVAVLLRFVGRRSAPGTRAAEWVLIAAMFLLASGALTPFGIGRTGFLTAFQPAPADANVFRGTDVVDGDWWFPLGVTFGGASLEVEGVARPAIIVTKRSEDPWSRLQQVITLEPEQTYTLSAVLRPIGDARPGFDGWGVRPGDDAATNLGTTLSGGAHEARATGALTVLHSSAVDLGYGLLRAQVTFRYEGADPLVWYVGVVPDRSSLAGASTIFAELQLTATDAPLPYVPGRAERGVASLRVSRYPIWQDALNAIGARPLVGWGPTGLPEAVSTLDAQQARLRPVASHAHNMLLAVWVERGAIGALGLVALFLALALRAVQQRDRAAAVVLLGVVALSTFDATLLSGAVLYPLAAVLGWRAVGKRAFAKAETGLLSATSVRLALALGDAAAGAAALALGVMATGGEATFTPALAYASLAWPIVGLLTRHYPAYGRPSHLELAGSVTVAATGSLLVAGATVLLPPLHLSAPALAVALGASLLLVPAFRALVKLVLRALHLWGRAVVVLGTGPSAARAASHLATHPGLGLHPVAAFGASTWDLANPPVMGQLDDAWDYVRDNRVQHAVVAPDAARELAFDEVLRRADRQLRYVQYLPDLGGLPTSSVTAAPLGASLALEVRNQLASPTNRTIKRAMDIALSSVMLLALAVPLLLIALLVRLDSAGSPFHLSPRVGRGGKPFRCLKFRTMYADAEERLEQLLETDPAARDEYFRYRKLTDDPRVTRVGRVLRRLSLDEFPQLVNVLLGQMSLVGPRPYLVSELADMGPERDLIFLARPGITGYWQVEARNEVSFEERQAMEAHYVRNWSVWWDLEILLRTPVVMLAPNGK
jgi:Undecaprenyl-phosphate galactose phosphotransferase WbaP